MGDSTDIAIRARRLTKKYASGSSTITVFQDLDLQIRAGEQVAVIGESGAGKSTLLHLLGGLDRPTSGHIYYGPWETTAMRDAELSAFRNSQIGFVWQSHGLLPEFTALENVMMPLLIRGVAQSTAAKKALAEIAKVGLEARAQHRAGELSGGEQQRVALARALVTKPKIVLADEPTGNLDFTTGETIAALFSALHESRVVTSLMVTHNLAFAKRCDRVLLLDQGRLQPYNEATVTSQ